MREDTYQNRCTKQLKEWGAPLEGWYCESVVDVKGDEDDWDDGAGLATCELCGCERVRFLHVMGNPDYFVSVPALWRVIFRQQWSVIGRCETVLEEREVF